MPCTLVRLVQFSKVFVTHSLSSDNYISISQLPASVNRFFKLFSKFFLTTIHHSPYGIRTRVTAVKRRCLNPLTNGPELFDSFYYTFFSPFVKNFFSSYTNSWKTIESSLSRALRPLKISPPMRRSTNSCFSLLCSDLYVFRSS